MRTVSAATAAHHPASRRIAIAMLLTLSLVAATPVAAVPSATGKNAAVITTWNQVAVSVIPANPAAFLNYAFVHLAMYNAVNGITGRYELYHWDEHANMSAAPEAAAAAAAHRILSTYFPTQASAAGVDAQLAASLAAIPSAARRDRGAAFGRLAADRIIALRANDGRGAAVMVPMADAAGEWRPTPPANAAFAVPWLGGVTPLAIDSLGQFDPGAPPALGTALYRAELAEVRELGELNSSTRSGDQTTTARYFADIPFGPMEAGLRDLATRRGLDISESARLFAATNTAIADAIGTAWNDKLEHMWWRPITAIQEIPLSDGDDATVPVSGWTPLITTPPYPDWPSGLCAVVGALTASLERLTGGVDITIVSPSQGARHWSSKAVLDQTAVDARVWSGIHFRTADAVSIDIGTDVTNLTLERYFQPSR
jgi:hypothetical protein